MGEGVLYNSVFTEFPSKSSKRRPHNVCPSVRVSLFFIWLFRNLVDMLPIIINLWNEFGGALAQWLKLPAWKVGDREFKPALAFKFQKNKMFVPTHSCRFNIVGSLRDREVVYSASDSLGSNFEFCVWRAVSSHSSQHPQEVLLAQFSSYYVHKRGLKPYSFHFSGTSFSL